MGTIKKGIMGGFSGKVGNIVGASWKGIAYIRSMPASIHNPRTEKQVTQRNKFSLIGRKLYDMKTNQIFLIALATLLLAGCRPGRMVTEKRRVESDSSAVWILRDSLQVKNSEIALLRSDLKRVREENVTLRSEVLLYEIKYDTAAPIDSATGRPPVMSERFTTHNSRFEKAVTDAELQHWEWSLERESLTRANSSLLLSVEQLTRENRELKEKTTLPSPFKRLLLPAGIILTILLLWLLLFRK